VARTRVDEPLPLTFVQVESGKQAGHGYLVVRVPASPRAPHMASGRYWGGGIRRSTTSPTLTSSD
jgi:hypothetical protein